MGSFQCPRCLVNCCTCSGCHPATSSDGTSGCTRCNPGYEQARVVPVIVSQALPAGIYIHPAINRPRNAFVQRYGLPQITFKRP